MTSKLENSGKRTPAAFRKIKVKVETKKTVVPLFRSIVMKTIPKAKTRRGKRLTR